MKHSLKSAVRNGICAGVFSILFSVQAFAAVTRDDGKWLFPMRAGEYVYISDWAGCTQAAECQICGGPVDNTHRFTWGDGVHKATKYGHNGMDIYTTVGHAVLASAPGKVSYISAPSEVSDARGNYVVLEHAADKDWSYYSYYQHLSGAAQNLKESDPVEAGAVIALSGESGAGSGPHLHFGIVFAPSGQKMTGKKLAEYENKGWLLSADNGTGGRILNNPENRNLAEENYALVVKNSVIPPLDAHAGSVSYTMDPKRVTVGANKASGNAQLSGAGFAVDISWKSESLDFPVPLDIEISSVGKQRAGCSIDWNGEGPTFRNGEGRPSGSYTVSSEGGMSCADLSTGDTAHFLIVGTDRDAVTYISIMGDDYDATMYSNQYLSDAKLTIRCLDADGKKIFDGEPKDYLSRWGTGIWSYELKLDWKKGKVGFP